jgi:lysophospholipase L1-like esterase
MKRFLKICGFTLLVLACLEFTLHIYNPFSSRVKNGEIILPKNTSYKITLPYYQGLDTQITHSKNSLGLRGPEINKSETLKIICMGGSTTECFYLNDGKDWPNILGSKIKNDFPKSWLNNAGMDGQSSFGNIQMLKQYILKLKPNYIILMCGLNDMGLEAPSNFDENKSILKKVYNFLEIPSTIINISRAGKAKKAGLNHQFISDISKAEKLKMDDTAVMRCLKKEEKYLTGYKNRLGEFAKICQDNNIKLIFVAQTILFSDEEDLFTNVYLGDVKTGQINGKTRAYILKMYNKVTFDFAASMGLPFINLAARLPKDSRFFYDGYHFTNDGAEISAGIIYDEIVSKNLIPEIKNGTNP